MSEENFLVRREEFEKALAPAIEWYQKNCDPH